MNYPSRFSKNPQISNFLKIRAVGAELFRADGQTDMTNIIVAFRNLANRPEELTFDPARLHKVFSVPYLCILQIYEHKNMLPMASFCGAAPVNPI